MIVICKFVICLFLGSKGIEHKAEVMEVYKKQQKRISVFARQFYYLASCGVALSMTIASLTTPLRYVLFGKPDPNTWRLSIDVE